MISRRETSDRVARSGRDDLIGDPRRGEEELRDLFGRLGGAPAGARCLEVGCGKGRMTVGLAKQFAEVLALDVSPSMIEQARAEVESSGLSGVSFQLVPGDSLDPVPDAWADVLICYLVLQHFPNRKNVAACLEEFERVLAPGGEAFVQLPVLAPRLTPRIRRRIRHAWPRAGASYRGFRLTDDELRKALDGLRLDVVAEDRDQRSPYRFCEEVFLRLRRP